MSPRRFRGWLLALSALAFLWVLHAPINQAGSDPRGSLLVAQALLETGSIRLDPYVAAGDLPSRVLYAHAGRVDYYFPLGAPLLSLPAVALARAAGLNMIEPGDEARLHNWLAALSVALVVAIYGAMAADMLAVAGAEGPVGEAGRGAASAEPAGLRASRRDAVQLLALVTSLSLGTGLASTLGTAFWSNDAAALSNLTLLLLVQRWIWPFERSAMDSPLRTGAGAGPKTRKAADRTDGAAGTGAAPELTMGRALVLGALATIAALSRPTSALLFILLVSLLAWRRRGGEVLRLLSLPIAGSLLFLVFSLRVYGAAHPPYYHPARLTGSERILNALYGNVLSPGRGFLVFSPLLLLVLLGIVAFHKRLQPRPLVLLCALWATAHLLTISQFPHWWDGHSYGNRLYLEAIPAWLVLGLVVWRAWHEATLARVARRASLLVALPLAAFGIWVHAWQGLYNLHTVMWNGGHWGETLGDLNIDEHPEYLFDWRYPQMLANRSMIAARFREHGLREIPYHHIGASLGADADPRYFSQGWYPLERSSGGSPSPAWRWSEGSATIHFRLDRRDLGQTPDRQQLVVYAGSLDGQSVELSLNGSVLGWIEPEAHFSPVGTGFFFDPSLLAEVNRLEFSAPDARAPEGDSRVLGLAFHDLRLVEDR